MALQEHFEQTGTWLFRWRSFLPLLLLPFLALSFIHYHYPFHSEMGDWIWEGICLFASFLGMGIRVWTIGCVPASTSGRNTKRQIAEQLNTSGIYSIVRHPLYLGNFFMMLGVAMFPCNVWLILVYMLLFMVYYERIMFTEEAFLRRKFGDAYLAWAEKTPAFFPRLSAYRPSELDFSFRNVLGREYNGFFAFVISLFVLEVVSEWIVNRSLQIDLFWAILTGFSFVSWLVLWSLKKYTRVLKVSGR